MMKIVCSKSGCPRTRVVDSIETDPPMAEIMKISCPWHEVAGEFDEPLYFNKQGKQIYQVGDNEYEIED